MTENVNELEERARRMGLVWYKFVRGVIDIFIAKGGDVDCPEAWFPLAETLLAALDPAAVRVVDFIEAEPEFPDEMPDELLNTFRETVGCDIRKGMAELICRVIVKVTKEAIINRLGPAREGYEYVIIERKVQE